LPSPRRTVLIVSIQANDETKFEKGNPAIERLILQSGLLFGPIYGFSLIGVYIARLRFSEARLLFELTESILALLAAILAIALGGIWVQLAG